MKNRKVRHLIPMILSVALPVGIAMGQSVTGPTASTEPTLEAVKEATARYQDVNAALEAGYIRDPSNVCETATMMGRPDSDGAMGIHYFRPDLLQITSVEPRVDGVGLHTDFLQPAVLIYEPQSDGSLALVAVENLVFKAAWDSLNAGPPSFHGVPFDEMVDDPSTELDESHMFASHYDRHVWIYRDNPNGVFAQFNPTVTCDHHATANTHQH